jgi:hypothetical protein
MTIKSIARTWLLFSTLWCVADNRGRPLTAVEMYGNAFHEAGHTVVTWYYGHYPVDCVWINDVASTIHDQPLGRTQFGAAIRANKPDQLWYEAAIHMAGGQSESMFTGGLPEGTDNDRLAFGETAAELLAIDPMTTPPWPIVGPLPLPLNATMVSYLATVRAADILEERQAEVAVVVAALERQRRLTHADLVRLLGPPGQK